ncbi:ABC transporter ATP-binding protein [Roseicyclus sp.]|uniref:ABC transporter ATP-binding protein n=1 Tax=Roseicyclus sp. TaxID=1914329 RepID=UPI003F9F169A
MIRFDGVEKGFRGDGRRKVLDGLTFELPGGRSVALLGRNGAGKSTLLQLVSGNLRPDRGRIARTGTVSWQVGYGGAFHPELTGAQNTRFVARVHGVAPRALEAFVARVHGVAPRALEAFVEDFAELGERFHRPVRTYSQGMKARLTFGQSMGIAFDTYLVDEVTATGDAVFREKSRAILRERLGAAGAIVVSHNPEELRALCTAGLVLEDGKARYFDDLEEAIARHLSGL